MGIPHVDRPRLHLSTSNACIIWTSRKELGAIDTHHSLRTDERVSNICLGRYSLCRCLSAEMLSKTTPRSRKGSRRHGSWSISAIELGLIPSKPAITPVTDQSKDEANKQEDCESRDMLSGYQCVFESLSNSSMVILEYVCGLSHFPKVVGGSIIQCQIPRPFREADSGLESGFKGRSRRKPLALLSRVLALR